MNVSTCATCLLLSCCASAITSFTPPASANNLRHQRILRGAIRLGVIALAEGDEKFFLAESSRQTATGRRLEIRFIRWQPS